MEELKIFLAADHAGVKLKDHLVTYLQKRGFSIINLGTHSPESVDYPDFAKKLADEMKDIPRALGILLCGSGIGISIAANRYKHIRAARVDEVASAELARQHNDANVICLGARLIGTIQAEKCVDAFLRTPFGGDEKHRRRIHKLLD